MPPLEQPTQAVNREFDSAAAERALRDELTASGSVRSVPYRCNRATIFVSDQYHESLPFRFAAGYEQRRVNLTLLFGDRWAPIASPEPLVGCSASGEQLQRPLAAAALSTGGAAAASVGAHQADGWDVFD